MLLHFSSGSPFATGASSFVYRPVLSTETVNRILVDIRLGSVQTQAYLDTGAVYMVCAPDLADTLNLSADTRLGSEQLVFRGTRYHGDLYRVPLTFLADEGESLDIEVTAFVPQIHPEDSWPIEFLCILGMTGCMERLRFAIDPFEDMIYFGVSSGDF